MKSNYEFVAYLDADLSSPLLSINDLIDALVMNDNYSVAYGSRTKRAGAIINRNLIRHYLGRLFTAFVDILLNIDLYDTQCGSKVFRSHALDKAFRDSFVTRWFFDIEIVLRVGKHKIMEVPVVEWNDKSGSKLSFWDYITAPIKIVTIYLKY